MLLFFSLRPPLLILIFIIQHVVIRVMGAQHCVCPHGPGTRSRTRVCGKLRPRLEVNITLQVEMSRSCGCNPRVAEERGRNVLKLYCSTV